MAILKSTAYGQARKSVGANNYYRRAGVQVVRSKPTFAPGRTFTDAQLMQQEVMKMAQYFGLKMGGRDIARYMNVTNNKLYNASSRYNRMLKNIMPSIKNYLSAIGTNPDTFWNEYGGDITETMSVGNYPAFPFDLKLQSSSSSLIMHSELSDTQFNSWVIQANKKRSKSGQFSYRNIGCVGVLHEVLDTYERTTVLQPSMLTYDDSPTSQKMEFKFEIGFEPNVDSDTYVNAVFFIADYYADEEPAIISEPQYCTPTQFVGTTRPPIP